MGEEGGRESQEGKARGLPAVEYLEVFSPGIGRCLCRGSVGVEEIGEGEGEAGP